MTSVSGSLPPTFNYHRNSDCVSMTIKGETAKTLLS